MGMIQVFVRRMTRLMFFKSVCPNSHPVLRIEKDLVDEARMNMQIEFKDDFELVEREAINTVLNNIKTSDLFKNSAHSTL